MARRRPAAAVDVTTLYPEPPTVLRRNLVADWVTPGEVNPPDDVDATTNPVTALLAWVSCEAWIRRRRARAAWLAAQSIPTEHHCEVIPFRGIPAVGDDAGTYLTAAGFVRRETDADRWRRQPNKDTDR